MAPIRIGFIGLSPGSWAEAGHWPYLKDSSKYQVVGVLNSTAESAQNAIKHFGLPSTTKAYATPEELADDPDVDLAVCSVRVDRHIATVKAAVAKGKPSFTEWPLASNLAQAETLNGAVTGDRTKNIIGLQVRQHPAIAKIRELIASGAIGKMLSVTVVAAVTNGSGVESTKFSYQNQDVVGGNILTIHSVHLLDAMFHAMGTELSSLSGLAKTQRPVIKIKDKDEKIVREEPRDTKDQIMFQGVLDNGAVMSVHIRGGDPVKGTRGLIWRIYGEKGEIDYSADTSFFQFGPANPKLLLHKHEGDTVEEISYGAADEFSDLPETAKLVARLYEAYADGVTRDLVSWEQAVERHRLVTQIVESTEKGQVITI